MVKLLLRRRTIDLLLLHRRSLLTGTSRARARSPTLPLRIRLSDRLPLHLPRRRTTARPHLQFLLPNPPTLRTRVSLTATRALLLLTGRTHNPNNLRDKALCPLPLLPSIRATDFLPHRLPSRTRPSLRTVSTLRSRHSPLLTRPTSLLHLLRGATTSLVSPKWCAR